MIFPPADAADFRKSFLNRRFRGWRGLDFFETADFTDYTDWIFSPADAADLRRGFSTTDLSSPFKFSKDFQ